MVEYLKRLKNRHIVLVLDPAELYPLSENRPLRDMVKQALRLSGIELPEPDRYQQRAFEFSDGPSSSRNSILEYVDKHLDENHVRIVSNNMDVADLMPDDMIAESVDHALRLLAAAAAVADQDT